MIKIRNRVFETNSSSVHVVAIPNDGNIEELEIPKKIEFNLFNKYYTHFYKPTDYQTKANYLYSCLFELCFNGSETASDFISVCRKIEAILLAHGVEEVKFYGFVELPDKQKALLCSLFDTEEGYELGVRNGGGFSIWEINKLLENSEYLIKFLFDPKTYALYGHDSAFDDIDYSDEVYEMEDSNNFNFIIND